MFSRLFKNIRNILKMPSPALLKKVKANANTAESIIGGMKSELVAMKNEAIVRAVRELEAENKFLLDEIEATKRKLIQLELARGVKQISVPNRQLSSDSGSAAIIPEPDKKSVKPIDETKPKKEKPTKVENSAVETSKKPKKDKVEKAPPVAEAPVDVGRLDMRIGLIKEVIKHPDADSLYVSKIDCGEPELRTVVSGLVRYVPREGLQGRLVVVLCNLKPVKMRGVSSEAMVMCASSPDAVEVLNPPAGCQPGDLVHCEGFPRMPDPVLNPKKKIFETCAPDLKTNDQFIACYKNVPLHVPGKGNIVAKSLSGVQVK